MTHPAKHLSSWPIAVVLLQFMGGAALFAMASVIVMAGQAVRRRWLFLVRRARWLLLTLWPILAYGTPGEAWSALPWAPTEAGVYEATLHAARLVVTLGTLAWLFERLPRDRLMAGLWALFQAFRRVGLPIDRIVVRLALVFDYLDHAPPKGSWRHLLDEPAKTHSGLDVVRIERYAWKAADSAGLVATAVVLGLGAVWA